MPRLVIGSKPIDGGHYIFEGEEKQHFLSREPSAEKFFHPYVGSREYLKGGDRWILYLADASPAELKAMPEVSNLIDAVREIRLQSASKPTNKIAETPTQYHVTVVPSKPFLVMPEVSSERRDYLPIGWLEPPIIPSNLVKVLLNANRSIFAVLTSSMHMSWLRHIGGRMKSDYRYSIGLVYNNFPWPDISHIKKKRLEILAQAVLDARSLHPEASLADLYNPNFMPPALRKAHSSLDLAVDRLYRNKPFMSERERVEHLFGLYEKMIILS